MSVPKSVVKFNKNGVTYTSSVDKAQYTITELTRAALRDVGKFIVRNCNSKAMQWANRSLKKSKRVRGKTSAFQYWVRQKESDLQVGIKHNTWYGVLQELGDKNQPRRGALRSTIDENIKTIIEIESQYLSALENEAKALALIDEGEQQGGEE